MALVIIKEEFKKMKEWERIILIKWRVEIKYLPSFQNSTRILRGFLNMLEELTKKTCF